MLNIIDNFLNRITMYRLVLYVLTALLAAAIVLSLFSILPYATIDIIFTLLVLVAVSLIVNKIFAAILKIPENVESDYITAFILALIVTPTSRIADLPFLIGVAAIAQASKYVLVYRRKHIFNPAALAVVISFFAFGFGASWWVGTFWLLPIVLSGGFLVVRKIQRPDFVVSFLLAYLIVILSFNSGVSNWSALVQVLLYSPILFFALIMLTEPQTTPPTRVRQIAYGIFVGLLFSPYLHFRFLYVTPELALVIGNIFSYILSYKTRYLMELVSKNEIAFGIYEFVFRPDSQMDFKPGQYLEWTLPAKPADNRGNRRYFTVASSPAEDVHLGVKFYEKPSTFKQHLKSLNPGDKVLAGQLAGDFTLPKDTAQKLIFIAGGIGVTPFRSMIKHMIDNNERRHVTLFYAVNIEKEIVYREIFDQAKEMLGINVVYVVSENNTRINRELISTHAPGFKDSLFYISGTHGMVEKYQEHLRLMEIPSNRIKVDFFPGYV